MMGLCRSWRVLVAATHCWVAWGVWGCVGFGWPRFGKRWFGWRWGATSSSGRRMFWWKLMVFSVLEGGDCLILPDALQICQKKVGVCCVPQNRKNHRECDASNRHTLSYSPFEGKSKRCVEAAPCCALKLHSTQTQRVDRTIPFTHELCQLRRVCSEMTLYWVAFLSLLVLHCATMLFIIPPFFFTENGRKQKSICSSVFNSRDSKWLSFHMLTMTFMQGVSKLCVRCRFLLQHLKLG